MTTTDLIKLLQQVEKGASGRSREISISFKMKSGQIVKILDENGDISILSTGDGIAGAELSLILINN